MPDTQPADSLPPLIGAIDVNKLPDGVVVMDASDRIVAANQAYAALLGYDVQQVLGQFGLGFVSEADRARARIGMQYARAHPDRALPATYWIDRANGTQLSVEALGSPYGADASGMWVVSVRARPHSELQGQTLMAIAASASMETVAQLVADETATRWSGSLVRIWIASRDQAFTAGLRATASTHSDQSGNGCHTRSVTFSDGVCEAGQIVVETDTAAADALVGSGIDEIARVLTIACTQARLKADLRRLSTTDPLTGVLNRRGLEEAYSSLGAAAGSSFIAVLVCDIDGLKQINDRHGHAAGDEAILAAAQLLETVAPDGAIVARVGGDEFVLSFPTNPDDLADILEDIRRPHMPVREPARAAVNLSAGAAMAGPTTTLEAALRQADRDLYRWRESVQRRPSTR
ncbi:MAG: diguanylate cyclase [Aquihabitans sp.]